MPDEQRVSVGPAQQPLVEGGPSGAAIIATTAALAGTAVGAGWVATLLERWTAEVQVVALQMAGLVVITAEIGSILIVLQYLCCAAAARRSAHDQTTASDGKGTSAEPRQTPTSHSTTYGDTSNV